MHSRDPAVSQIGVAVKGEFFTALLLDHAAADIDTAILHGIDVEAEIGPRTHFAAEFDRLGGSPRREVLNTSQRIVASVNGPIVGQTEHFTEGGAVTDVGRHETALAGQLFKRFVIKREIENGYFLDVKHGAMGDGPIVGIDIELGAGEPPPGFGNLAIGDKAVMDNIFAVAAFAPLAFEIERVVGGEQAGPRDDGRRRGAFDGVEDTALGVDVVGEVIAEKLGAVQEIL